MGSVFAAKSAHLGGVRVGCFLGQMVSPANVFLGKRAGPFSRSFEGSAFSYGGDFLFLHAIFSFLFSGSPARGRRFLS